MSDIQETAAGNLYPSNQRGWFWTAFVQDVIGRVQARPVPKKARPMATLCGSGLPVSTGVVTALSIRAGCTAGPY